jgi:hypothetical protein
LPPVAVWQARVNAASTGPSKCPATSRALASAESGAGEIALATGSEAVAAKRPIGSPRLRTCREKEQHRQIGQPRREEGEEPQRVAIGPMGIVEEEQQRPLLGEVRDQPVEAVEGREARVAAGGATAVEAEGRGRVGSNAVEELRAPRGRQVTQAMLEELARGAKRKLALELGGAGRERRHPAPGEGPRGPRQRRLADPGRALDQHHRSLSVEGAPDRLLDSGELRLALEQLWVPRAHDRLRRA